MESQFFKTWNGNGLGKLEDRFEKIEGKFLLFLPRELKEAGTKVGPDQLGR